VPAFVAVLLTGLLLAGQQPAPRRVLLDVAARPPAAAAAGARITVALDLTPAPGIHVYAPGVVGYKPLALQIKPQAGVVVRGVTFPPSESYYYAPLKETVAVYQKPFSVVQELTLGTGVKGVKAVTVQGTLSYQACDEKICYPPRQVPVTWQVPLKEE
jgi:DsbC/DsbD-like thiol-disulfide interchange protein